MIQDQYQDERDFKRISLFSPVLPNILDEPCPLTFQSSSTQSKFQIQNKLGNEENIKSMDESIEDSVFIKLHESVELVEHEESQQTNEKKSNEEKVGLSCNTCGCSFQNRPEQVEHFKSEWHQANLQRKLKNLDSISQDQFSQKETANSTSIPTEDDGSDIDSDTDEETDEKEEKLAMINRTPKLYFTNKRRTRIFSIYRSILRDVKQDSKNCLTHTKNTLNESDGVLISEYISSCRLKEPSPKKEINSKLPKTENSIQSLHPCSIVWVILMVRGGHFAGGVFVDGNCIIHKTFHRYTIRKKRGQQQSTKDNNSSHTIHSAGAEIRRYNEKALILDIRKVLNEWKDWIDCCKLLFYTGAQILFHTPPPMLDKRDDRFRSIPLISGRPTYKEVVRVFNELSFVSIIGHNSLPYEIIQSFKIYQTTDEKSSKEDKKDDNVVIVDEKKNKLENSQDKEERIFDSRMKRVWGFLFGSQQRSLKELEYFFSSLRNEIKNEMESKLKPTQTFSEDIQEEVDFYFQNIINDRTYDQDSHNTLLHQSVILENSTLVSLLLTKYNSNVELVNIRNRTPFLELKKDSKNYKNIWRMFVNFAAENPNVWDYKKAMIPTNVSEKKRNGQKKKPENSITQNETIDNQNYHEVDENDNNEEVLSESAIIEENLTEEEKQRREKQKMQRKKKKQRQKELNRQKKQQQKEEERRNQLEEERRNQEEEERRNQEEEKRKKEKEEKEEKEKKKTHQEENQMKQMIPNQPLLTEQQILQNRLREQRAHAAELRMGIVSQKRLFTCETCKKQFDYEKVIPFERYDWKYCSMSCLKTHKLQTS